MKKILAIFLCAVMVCAMFVTVHADEEIPADEEEAPTSLTTEAENVTETENPVTETEPPTVETEAPVTEATPPVTDEDTSFDDFWAALMTTGAPVTEPTVTVEINKDEEQPTVEASFPTTDEIIDWVQDHFEEISVIITLIYMLFYQVLKHAALNKSVATLNNNSIMVAENSNLAIANALAEVTNVSNTFGSYKDEMASLLNEIRETAEQKQKLQGALTQVENYLQTAKLANVEIANEVAELLVLANIPNSKKEELYARHRAAVDAIAAAEKTEVKNDVVEDVAQEA